MTRVAGSGAPVRLGIEKRAREESMGSAPTLSEVDQAALGWFVAARGGDADAAALADWRSADPRHEQAYARIERLWGSAAFAGAVKRARPRAGRTAAGAAAMALCLAVITTGSLRLSGATLAWPADHSAPVGEIAVMRLDDGTRLILDSGSAIDVSMDRDRRDIRLLRGRVSIAVADDERPLRLLSGDAVVRDIGTRFFVSREEDGEHVAVAEGIVDLRASGESRALLLGAGEGGALKSGRLGSARRINELEAFGWTDGRLYFSNRPLGEVVEELRRYHRGWIVVTNDRAASLRVSGGLSLDDPAIAMKELARLSGTRLSRVTDRLLILR